MYVYVLTAVLMFDKQTFSERRSQFRERKVSAAHFSNHERKKSAAHFLLDERMMSAEVSKERKKSAENKFSKKLNRTLIKILNFPFINSIKTSNYISCQLKGIKMNKN